MKKSSYLILRLKISFILFFLFVSISQAEQQRKTILANYKHTGISKFNSKRVLNLLKKQSLPHGISYIICKKLPDIDLSIFQDYRTLSADTLLKDKYSEAKELYFSTKYKEAIVIFNECQDLLEENIMAIDSLSKYTEVLFYLGISHYALNTVKDMKKADEFFDRVLILDPDYFFKEDNFPPSVMLVLKKIKLKHDEVPLVDFKVKSNTHDADIYLNMQHLGKTDEKGLFQTKIYPANYLLEIKKPGYKYFQQKLTYMGEYFPVEAKLEFFSVEKYLEPGSEYNENKKRVAKFLLEKLGTSYLVIPQLFFYNEVYYLRADFFWTNFENKLNYSFAKVSFGNNLMNLENNIKELTGTLFEKLNDNSKVPVHQ